MSHLGLLVLCLVGFAGLALATDRQQAAVLGRKLGEWGTRGLRLVGACALLAAGAALVAWQGWALGLVMFSGYTSLAAGLVHCTLIGYARLRSGPSRTG